MHYLHYDVFTSEPLLGNQLAVFPDGVGLTTAQMQAIAREINFSETTFILPAERADTDIRMRIFTPAVEDADGRAPDGRQHVRPGARRRDRARPARFVFGLNVGPTPVDLEWEGGRVRFVWMTQGRPTFGGPSPIAPPWPRRLDCAWTISSTIYRSRKSLAACRTCSSHFAIARPWIARTRDAVAMLELHGIAVASRRFSCLRCRTGPPESEAVAGGPVELAQPMFAPVSVCSRIPPPAARPVPLGCYSCSTASVTADEARQIDERAGREDGPREPHPHRDHRHAGCDYRGQGWRRAVLVARGEFLAVPADAAAPGTQRGNPSDRERGDVIGQLRDRRGRRRHVVDRQALIDRCQALQLHARDAARAPEGRSIDIRVAWRSPHPGTSSAAR